MGTIQLRPVAVTDLSVRYARDMGNKKIRHYRVSAMTSLINKFTGLSAQDMVRDFIKKEEGQDVEFLEQELEDEGFGLIGEKTQTLAGGIQVADVSAIVLQRDRAIGKALTKIKSYNMILETNWYPTVFHKYYDSFVHLYNSKIAPRANRLLYRLQGGEYGNYNAFFYQMPFLRQIYIRDFDPAHFISVAFEASDATRALEAMRDDLRLLHEKRLIKGHLSMPSIMRLADTVGFGRYFVLFCFPIIDHRRLLKIQKLNSPMELPSTNQLGPIGVRYETHEGSIKWLDEVDPGKMYGIEEVNVTGMTSDEAHQAQIDSYNAAKPFFQKAAQRTKQNLQDYEKVESRTHQAGINHVAVDVTLRNKKSGDVVKVDGDLYRKNEGVTIRKEDEE